MTDVDGARAWLTRYERTPRHWLGIIRHHLRTLRRAHRFVFVPSDDGKTWLRCQKCGRRAWFEIRSKRTTAGVEGGCPMTERLAAINAQWMDEIDHPGEDVRDAGAQPS